MSCLKSHSRLKEVDPSLHLFTRSSTHSLNKYILTVTHRRSGPRRTPRRKDKRGPEAREWLQIMVCAEKDYDSDRTEWGGGGYFIGAVTDGLTQQATFP